MTTLQRVIEKICVDYGTKEEEMYRMVDIQMKLFPIHEISLCVGDGEFWRTVVAGKGGLPLLKHSVIEKMDNDEVDRVYVALCGCKPIAISNIRQTIRQFAEKQRKEVGECDLFLLYKAIHRYTVVDNGEDVYKVYHETRCQNLCQQGQGVEEEFCSKECKDYYTKIINYL